MNTSLGIRIKAVLLALTLIVGAPLFFLLAGIREQLSQGKFLWGVKIMAATYADVYPDLYKEIRDGVSYLSAEDNFDA